MGAIKSQVSGSAPGAEVSNSSPFKDKNDSSMSGKQNTLSFIKDGQLVSA